MGDKMSRGESKIKNQVKVEEKLIEAEPVERANHVLMLGAGECGKSTLFTHLMFQSDTHFLTPSKFDPAIQQTCLDAGHLIE
jgi:predicted AAA+ superfamily ATPase